MRHQVMLLPSVGPRPVKKRRSNSNGAAAATQLSDDGDLHSDEGATRRDGDLCSDEDDTKRVQPRETDNNAAIRRSKEAVQTALHDLGIEMVLDDDDTGESDCSGAFAAGIAAGDEDFLQSVRSLGDVDVADDDETAGSGSDNDDGWSEGGGVTRSVGCATSREEPARRKYDAHVDGVDKLEEFDFKLMAYRQLAVCVPPPVQQTSRPQNHAWRYEAGDMVEFAVENTSGIWDYYGGSVVDVTRGLSKNADTHQKVNIVASDGTGEVDVRYDLVRRMSREGRKGKGLSKFRSPLRSEEEAYMAEFGGLQKSTGGKVGWGLRQCVGPGEVYVLPLRPVDARNELWARVGGDKSDLVHTVKVGDILLGMLAPAPSQLYHRRASIQRPVYGIPLDPQMAAEDELVLLVNAEEEKKKTTEM